MDTVNNEMHRKRRKNAPDTQDFHLLRNDDEDNELLTLSLSSFPKKLTDATSSPPSQPFANLRPEVPDAAANPLVNNRKRRNPSKTPPAEKSSVIPPPYPWADCVRATVFSLNYLLENRITVIAGDVHCKKCEKRFQIEFDLEQKFAEIANFIAENKASMHHRAPDAWKSPALPNCGLCKQEGCVRPVISEKKRSINWLFLFLGQMLGHCTLEQLKYFCKHAKLHRTGAKDRVLFLAYLNLCKQLDPSGPFDI